MLRILEAERMDVIVITGDLINITSDYSGLHDVLVRHSASAVGRPIGGTAFFGRVHRGWFERLGTRMYVSRGVGTSILDARFWCRAEIAIITVGA